MATVNSMLREGALKGQVIVITGGGTGLGRSMAEAFLRLGARVCITSRKLEVLQATAAELEKATGGTVLPVACDVREWRDVDRMLEQVLAKFGRADALVNDAAGNFISPTERLSSKAFETIIGIVLMGTVNCTLAFGKHWIAKGEKEKKVLNITTTYAWTGSGYVVPSACAKACVSAARSCLVTCALSSGFAISCRSPTSRRRPGKRSPPWTSALPTCGGSWSTWPPTSPSTPKA